MERNTQKSGIINWLTLLVVAAAGFAVARYTHSLAGQLAAAFVALGMLVGLISWFQMRLEENERLEKLEVDELAKAKAGSALFESKAVELFPARRAREQFERFFVPIFTGVLLVLQAVGAWSLWQVLLRPVQVLELRQGTVAMALFGLFALLLFLLGKFSSTVARLEHHRLLRPGASCLLLGAYLCLLVAIGLVGAEAGFPRTDFYLACGLCGLLALTALETLITLLLEIYRPRVKGKIERPLYESRLVGLLAQPEGLVTTAAQALDYQFGFKVSDTWFYRFFEKYLGWLLLAQLAVLLLSTGVVFIEPGEQGVLERFGKTVSGRALLDPGAHWKWPWPIDRVYRFQTARIQSFDVGYIPSPEFERQETSLWTIPHSKDEVNFLVANREKTAVVTTNLLASGRRPPPVSLLTVSIPVHFQIDDVLAWAYNNQNASNLLFDIATSEAVRYFVNVDLEEVMSRERGRAADELRQRIQAAADRHQLGARITFVGLQDIHPPVKVAGDYEKVVGAGYSREAKILGARAEEIRTNALSSATATNLIDVAEADRVNREIGALARAALFTNRIPAFAAAPSVYMERLYLDMFVRATAGSRKYIILTTNTDDIVQFDLEDRIAEDLLNLNVNTPKK